MFRHIIICHIDVGICVNNERGKRFDCVDELWRGVNHVCFFHTDSMAYFGAFFKGFCATLIGGTRGVDLLSEFPHIIKVA